MKTIHKFHLSANNHGIVTRLIPNGAKILYAGTQDGDQVMLWAEVDTDEIPVSRNFFVAETGKHIPEQFNKYLDTVLLFNGRYVVHIYEETK